MSSSRGVIVQEEIVASCTSSIPSETIAEMEDRCGWYQLSQGHVGQVTIESWCLGCYSLK